MNENELSAVAGDLVTFKHVPTRGVVQLIVEIPVSQMVHAWEVLGVPDPGQQIRVGIARIVVEGRHEEI